MRLVFLYGPPGVGKLTVGEALSRVTGFRLFHNHLTVNLVTALFPPNTEAWNQLAHQIRFDALSAAASEGIDLIYTRAPRAADQPEVDRVRMIIEPVLLGGGQVLFVHLVCDREALRGRVQRDDRRAHNKLTDPDVLVRLFDLRATLPFTPHLRIDTTNMVPAKAATHIATHFDLPLRSSTHRRDPG